MVADMPSTTDPHNTSEPKKMIDLEDSTHHEGTESPDSNEKSHKDVERTASDGQDYELRHLPVNEYGEPVVTMKTWAVIIVSYYGIRALSSCSLIAAAGARNFIRSLILASTLLQPDSVANGRVVWSLCRSRCLV